MSYGNKALCQDFLIQVLKVSVLYAITFSRITMSVVTCYSCESLEMMRHMIYLCKPSKILISAFPFWCLHSLWPVGLFFHSTWFLRYHQLCIPCLRYHRKLNHFNVCVRHGTTTSSTNSVTLRESRGDRQWRRGRWDCSSCSAQSRTCNSSSVQRSIWHAINLIEIVFSHIFSCISSIMWFIIITSFW